MIPYSYCPILPAILLPQFGGIIIDYDYGNGSISFNLIPLIYRPGLLSGMSGDPELREGCLFRFRED